MSRDPYLAVAAAMGQAIGRANAANLSVKKHRTVLACLALTAGESRFAVEVYVEQVRRLTGPSEEEWLDERTIRGHLIEFARLGIFGWRTRRGTDAEGRGFPSTLTLPKVGQTGRYGRSVSSAKEEGANRAMLAPGLGGLSGGGVESPANPHGSVGETGRAPGDLEDQTSLGPEEPVEVQAVGVDAAHARDESDEAELSRIWAESAVPRRERGYGWEPGA